MNFTDFFHLPDIFCILIFNIKKSNLEMETILNSPVLLIDSPDEKGLIHKITGVIFGHDHNIICNNEYVDHETCRFFYANGN